MNNPKKKFRSEDSVSRLKKTKNSETRTKNSKYNLRKNADEKELNTETVTYLKHRFGSNIDESMIESRRSKRLKKIEIT